MTPKKIAIIICGLLFVVILLQNSDPTWVELLFWNVQMPLFILIIVTVLLGWMFGWFSHVAFRRGRNRSKIEKGAHGTEVRATKSQSQTESKPQTE